MKTNLILIIAVLLSCTAKAQNYQADYKGIRFQNGSFKEILAKAKSENKLLFIDAYTAWCGPCKMMDKKVFTNDTVGEFYNSHFICAKIDMEKGEGPMLLKLYEVNCYPTYLFIDGTGKLLHRVSGACPIQSFIEIGKVAINPEKQFTTLKAKCAAGKINSKEFLDYISLRDASNLEVTNEIEKYFKIFPQVEYCSRMHWYMLKTYDVSYDSPLFKDLVYCRESFYKLYTKDSVNRVINRICINKSNSLYSDFKLDTVGFKKLQAELAAFKLKSLEQRLSEMKWVFYKETKNWPQYAVAGNDYINRYVYNDAYWLNIMAYIFLINDVKDSKCLDVGITWVKRSIEIQKKSWNTHIYACLLYLYGKKTEAIAMQKEAIKLAENREDKGFLVGWLENFEAMSEDEIDHILKK